MAADEHPHSQDFYSILGITKGASMREIGKAYKSLVMKWHPDKHHHSNKKEAKEKFVAITEAYKALNDNNNTQHESHKDEEPTASGSGASDTKRSKDESFFARRPSFLSRTKSRNQPASKTSAGTNANTNTTTEKSSPTIVSQSTSTDPFNAPLNISPPTFVASTLTNCPRPSLQSQPSAAFMRSASRRPGSTPILFSNSAVRRKAAPVERKLECTLEELYAGAVKKVKLTRDVISTDGIVQREEILQIKLKAGWKKGTKITFEGKGDEKPGFLPADITFIIDEKRHHLFKRLGDDLDLSVEIPLVKALTGCSISVPLIGGEKMNLSIAKVIYPGYEEIIPGQGMPNSKERGRGDLRIRFLVEFPTKLTDQQRAEAYEILKDCC